MFDFDALDPRDVDLGPAADILAYWERVRGDRFAPAWQRDFNLFDLPSTLIPCMTVIDRIEGGGNFRYRFWGTCHVAMKGFEMSGKNFDELPNRAIQAMGTRQLEIVIQRRRPTVFVYKLDYPGRQRLTEFNIRLPLSDDGETIDRFVSYQDLNSVGADWEDAMENLMNQPRWDGVG